MIARTLTFFFSILLCDGLHAQAAPSSPAPVAHQSCHANLTKPTEADSLLARESYKQAEAAFRVAITSGPAGASADDARLGLVRALLGEDRVADVKAEAAAMLKDNPASAVAEVAASEAAYRAGDPEAALNHAKTAIADDPCEGRAAVAIAAILDLNGYYAKSAGLYSQAHQLRPNDELIRRDWIDSLPRRERQEQLSAYLAGDHALSETENRGYENELNHLKARQPGECRVTSKAETAKVPMQLVYGDNPYPVALGLDVAFDGKRRRMELDTGASGITLTASAARELKLTPEYKLKTGGIGDEGEVNSYLTHVHSIRIGDVEVSDCMVEVVAKSKLDIDGLIGADVFRRWVVTLDFPDKAVLLAPLPPRPGGSTEVKLDSNPLPSDIGDETDAPKDRYIAPDMGNWMRTLRIGHLLLLDTRIKEGPFHYVVMDTGAQLSSLAPELAKETGKLHSSDMEITGLSGKVKKAYEVERVPLRVANLVLPPDDYPVFDITNVSHDAGFEVSGFLGLPTLRRLTISIDYRDNLLKIAYDPKKDMERF